MLFGNSNRVFLVCRMFFSSLVPYEYGVISTAYPVRLGLYSLI